MFPLFARWYSSVSRSLWNIWLSRVDVLAGQSIDDIFADLRACKTDYVLEYKRYRAVRGDKSWARDAAFRLLFLIIHSEFSDEKKDPAKVYNAVLFVVSNPATFKQAMRTAVRSVFDERFVVSTRQRSQLDRWKRRLLSTPQATRTQPRMKFLSHIFLMSPKPGWFGWMIFLTRVQGICVCGRGTSSTHLSYSVQSPFLPRDLIFPPVKHKLYFRHLLIFDWP